MDEQQSTLERLRSALAPECHGDLDHLARVCLQMVRERDQAAAALAQWEARWRELYKWASRETFGDYMQAEMQRLVEYAQIGPGTAEQIYCPLCGLLVRQIASDTLSLALWQHVEWACPNRHPDTSSWETRWRALLGYFRGGNAMSEFGVETEYGKGVRETCERAVAEMHRIAGAPEPKE